MARRSSVSPGEVTATCLSPEHWPFLADEQLQRSRGRSFCLSCQWFQHHPGPSCVPLLLCAWQQRQIAQGQQGWAPELG